MTTRLKKNYPTLKLLHKAKPKLVKAVINNSPSDFIHCLADCCHNLLKDNIRITKHQKERLESYKGTLRKFKTTCQCQLEAEVNPKRRIPFNIANHSCSCNFGNCGFSSEEMKKMILVDPNSCRKPMQKEMSKLDKEMSQILKSELEESEKIKHTTKFFKNIYY